MQLQLRLLSLFCSLLLFAIVLPAQDWTQLATLPGVARHHPVTFSLDGFGYVLTGGSDQGRLEDMYRYDPVADEWTQLDDFPGGFRSFAYGVAYEGKAYVGFGNQSVGGSFNGLNDMWRYDPVLDEWEQLADCRCSGRAHPAMVAADGKIFVGLGNDDFGSDRNDWWQYDIASDEWTQKPDFPSTRRHHPFYFDIDGMVYVGFGHHSVDIFNDMYRYDPSTEEWMRMADLPAEGRVAGTQFSFAGKGYLLSGDGDDHSFMNEGEFWEYDPVTDSWQSLPPHPGTSRWAPGSFLIDDKVYFTGGQTDRLERDLWVYSFNSPVQVTDILSESETLYPNPANQAVSLRHSEEVTMVEVYAMDGSKVLHVDAPSSRIDVSSLAGGVYSVRIVRQGKASTASLSIVR